MSDLDLDLDAAVQRAQRAKTAVVQLANDLHNVHPSPHDHDYDETILAALDAVFPLVAEVLRLRAELEERSTDIGWLRSELERTEAVLTLAEDHARESSDRAEAAENYGEPDLIRTYLATGNRIVGCVNCHEPVAVTRDEARDDWRCGRCDPSGMPVRAGGIVTPPADMERQPS